MVTAMVNSQDHKVISPDSTVDSYLNQDEDAVILVSAVSIRPINWKKEMREKPIRCVTEDDGVTQK